jgi:hypothetical protein
MLRQSFVGKEIMLLASAVYVPSTTDEEGCVAFPNPD